MFGLSQLEQRNSDYTTMIVIIHRHVLKEIVHFNYRRQYVMSLCVSNRNGPKVWGGWSINKVRGPFRLP